MEFSSPPEVSALRAEVRRFLAENLTDEIVERAHATGTMHDWGFHKALAATGWLAAPWPAAEGGQDRGPLEMQVLLEEMARAAAPVDGWITTMNVASTLRAVATPDLCAEVLPPVLAADALICLGLTEPEAGSDVGAVQTRASAHDGWWTIDGQKMFTTLAHESRWVFLLTRSDPDAPKHRGLTVLLVPMDRAGIEVRAVETLGGERTNITFYSGVEVEDRYRVGDVGGGWNVLMTVLAFERGGQFGGTSQFIGALARLLDFAAEWAATGPPGARPIDDPLVAARLGRAAADLDASRLLATKSAGVAASGSSPVLEAAMAKLFASEAFERAANDLLELLGPEGVRRHAAGDAPAQGWLEHAYRHAAVTTIYGGTSEMMRTIIARAGLRLPRPAHEAGT